MRILMLEPAARNDVASFRQRLNDGLVGVALLALVVEHALAGETRRLRRESPVLIDGVGDSSVDAARGELAAMRHPDIEVVAAMPRRGMNETGAGVVGDMIAVKQRHAEAVTLDLAAQRMRTHELCQRLRRNRTAALIGEDTRLTHHIE